MANKKQKPTRRHPQFKRDGMPFWGEIGLNEILKTAFSLGFFWLFYYPVYDALQPDFLTNLSYIVMFSVLSSMAAVIISFYFMKVLLYLLRRPKKGMFDLNKLPRDILYEMLIIVINAALIASGLLIFLGEITVSWEQLFLLVIVTKIIARAIAFITAIMVQRNIMLALLIYAMFFIILIMGFMNFLNLWWLK